MVELLEDALADVGMKISDARILVLGYAYLENSDDTRHSPSAVLVARLRERGAVVMVAHEEYLGFDLPTIANVLKTRLIIDGRHICEFDNAALSYYCAGLGRRLGG